MKPTFTLLAALLLAPLVALAQDEESRNLKKPEVDSRTCGVASTRSMSARLRLRLVRVCSGRLRWRWPSPERIEFEGALRHVPLSGDASPTTMWEKARISKNRYMNGAYWHVPVGWLLTILQPEHPELAQAVKGRWLGHLRAQQGKV